MPKKALITLLVILALLVGIASLLWLLLFHKPLIQSLKVETSSFIGNVVPVFKRKVFLENFSKENISISSTSEEMLQYLETKNSLLGSLKRVRIRLVNEPQDSTVSWEETNGEIITYLSYSKSATETDTSFELVINMHMDFDAVRKYGWSNEKIETVMNIQVATLMLDVNTLGGNDKLAPLQKEFKNTVESGKKFIEFKGK